MATMSLFAAGILITLLLMYQNLAESDSISRQDAIGIALAAVDKEPNRNADLLPNERVEAKLVHVTEGGVAFWVDENSMSDMWLYTRIYKFNTEYENRYFWHVDVTTLNDDERSRGYWYLVDVMSGQVIGNDRSLNLYAVT